MTEQTDYQAIRSVLKEFQDGYERRDPELLDDFQALFVRDDELEVIGTAAVDPGDEEWCLGLKAACVLIGNDWSSWGDLVLDVAEARIHALGNVAWLSTTGSVTMKLDSEETYQDYLDYIREEVAEDEDLSARERLLEILRGGSNTLFEAERGSEYIWPLRFTAVLVRRQDTWLIHQIHFSFATTRFPDVRNL